MFYTVCFPAEAMEVSFLNLLYAMLPIKSQNVLIKL